ncbi:MAG: AAA family ATPase, partial [Myxococcota bacterium]
RSVIVDASFRTRALRGAIRQLACRLDVPFTLIECVAPRETCLQRLAARERAGTHESDARSVLWTAFESEYEPVAEIPGSELIRIDTSHPWERTQSEIQQGVGEGSARFSGATR